MFAKLGTVSWIGEQVDEYAREVTLAMLSVMRCCVSEDR